jgi:hypothetical protein
MTYVTLSKSLIRWANNPTFFYRNNERIQQGELSQRGDKGCGFFSLLAKPTNVSYNEAEENAGLVKYLW